MAIRRENYEAKKNIAMLGHKRIPSREGGIEVVVEALSTIMVQKGYSVTCYNRKGHNVAGAEFDGKKMHAYKGIKLKNVFTIDCRGLAAMTASMFASFKAAFGKYDVVHIHAEGPAAFCWLPRLMGKKVVVTVHGAVAIIGTLFNTAKRQITEVFSSRLGKQELGYVF